jgi:predicted ester cyclase
MEHGDRHLGEETSVVLEANKAVVRMYDEAWNTPDETRRAALFDEVLSPGFWDEMPEGRRTREQLIAEASALHAAADDVGSAIALLIAEGEWVACWETVRYTDRATGRRVEVSNPFFARVVGGQMVEGFGCYDRLSVQEQTGTPLAAWVADTT